MAKKKKKATKKNRHILRTLWIIAVLVLLALIGFMLLSNPDLSASVNPFATATPVPTATPMPIGHEEIDAEAIPDANKPSAYNVTTKVYADGEQTSSYSRTAQINMPSSAEYASLEGVTTFRGNNYRDIGSYGYVPDNASSIAIKYNFKIGGIDTWTGVGWTGQPAMSAGTARPSRR